MSVLTLGSGFSSFLGIFTQFEGAQGPKDFLESDSTEGAAFATFLDASSGAMTVAKNTATQGILRAGDIYLVISGTGLSLKKATSGKGSTGTFGDYLTNSTGTLTTMRAYQGGSVVGGTYSGGTLIGTMTVGASAYTLTVGNHEVVLDGTGLPTSCQAVQSLISLDYTGGSLSFSDVKYVTGGTTVKTFKLSSDPLFSALNDYQTVIAAIKEISDNGDIPVKVLQAGSTKINCKYGDGFLVFKGTGLSYSGSWSLFKIKYLTGTLSSIQFYTSGSDTGGTVSGTLGLSMTQTSTRLTVTSGNLEWIFDGTNLPTTITNLIAVMKGTYSGSAIGVTDLKIMKDGVQAAAITVSSTELDITLMGYKLAFTGTFSTSLSKGVIDGTGLPTLKTTGVTITKVSGGATVLSISGLTSAVSLFNSDGKLSLDALFNTLKSIDGSTTTAAITVDLNNGMFANVRTVTGGSGKDTFTAGVGTDTLNGGAGNDKFYLGATLTASDKIDGGTGTDTLYLDGNYSAGVTFNSTTVKNVEKIALTDGYSYKLTTNGATVAAGQTLTIDGSALTGSNVLTFNGAAETNGHFIIIGGKGADKLTGGALSDTFVYTTAAQSTSTHYDTITGFNFSNDIFDTPGAAGTITGIDTKVTSGSLSTATFNTDLTAAMSGHLGAHHAILFTPNAGTLSGETFLVVDLNGTAGYQSGHDLVIRMISSTGTLAAGGFH